MQAKTKRVKYVMTYIKENTNINEHRRVIVKLNNKNILKSAYRDTYKSCITFGKYENIWGGEALVPLDNCHCHLVMMLKLALPFRHWKVLSLYESSTFGQAIKCSYVTL